MSAAIRFLETLARQPYADYERTLATAVVDGDVRDALAARDAARLNELLGGRHNVACMVLPAENEPQDDAPAETPADAPQHDEAARAA